MAPEEHPTDLAGFGYAFNEDGELRSLEDGERYKFDVFDGDKEKNQKRYEALGQVDADSTEPRSCIFCTPNYATCDRLLVLIHGSGAVRAGQWARRKSHTLRLTAPEMTLAAVRWGRLIINDTLDSGTQLPYISRALDRRMGVIVMNTNLNSVSDGRRGRKYIRGSEDSLSHGDYVWRHFVSPSQAANIAVVAHSAGGFVTCSLAKTFAEDFATRVQAVCFTDAAYGAPHMSKDIEPHWKRLMEITCDWVCDHRPLGHSVSRGQLRRYKLPTVSCGVTQHERSSHAAIDAVWEYIDDRIEMDDEEEDEAAAASSPVHSDAPQQLDETEYATPAPSSKSKKAAGGGAGADASTYFTPESDDDDGDKTPEQLLEAPPDAAAAGSTAPESAPPVQELNFDDGDQQLMEDETSAANGVQNEDAEDEEPEGVPPNKRMRLSQSDEQQQQQQLCGNGHESVDLYGDLHE